MARTSYIFTSEGVSEGHPDKVADRISDEVVDAYLSADPEARVACETLVTTNRIIIAGEARGPASVTAEKIEHLAREAVRDIGYAQGRFHWKDAAFQFYMNPQSAEIAKGVDATEDKDEGAGDQGIMFGYAVDETPELMPAPIMLSHHVLKNLAGARHSGVISALEPDAKAQISLVYENGKPVRATKIVVSHQHKPGLTPDEVREIIRPYVIAALPDESWMCDEANFFVNPTGSFVQGGPDGDCGLTGRKIIVDTYGGASAHGGGAFSGKDPTKVDRSAAYACRYLARNVVAAGLAKKCSIQISYAIGVAKPLSFYVDLFGTGQVDEVALERVLPDLMGGLTPRAIRTHLKLNAPIYARTAAYGHFGRTATDDGGFSWERDDLVAELRRHFNLCAEARVRA